MKYFLIKYRLKEADPEAWHQEVSEFISALDRDPELQGKISYRCMRNGKSLEYYHLAGATDDQIVKTMQQREFFRKYSARMKAVSEDMEVSPVEIVAVTRLTHEM